MTDEKQPTIEELIQQGMGPEQARYWLENCGCDDKQGDDEK